MAARLGSRLGPYELVERLGEGGMGEVYRARDTRLGREVAIKVLREDVSANPDRLRRLEQEARAVAALNHPNICQLYDVGPGYLVLELVDGRAPQGPMAAEAAVRLALQIAEALDAAHRRGLLHRDLKPANILVRPDGTAKLLDFGVAKLLDTPGGADDVTRTVAGDVLGTAAYMSPEQAQGRALDVRSDIFSFGVVFYELVSGRRAFNGASASEVLSAVLRDDPLPLSGQPALDRLVRRCLRKDPAERFQSMAELKGALSACSAPPVDGPSIAVLPFDNMSGDKENEYFSDGLAEEIINALAQIEGLKVIARTSAFAFKGRHEDVRRIAETLGVATVLEGSVRRAGARIRVTAQLVAASDGSHVWSNRYDRDLTDVFAIQDDIAAAIAKALAVRLAGRPERVQGHTPAMPAYDAFLKGRQHLFRFRPESWTRFSESLTRAIDLDPAWARPHAELGLGYLFAITQGLRSTRDAVPLMRAEASRALELDPSEPAPHFLLGSAAAVLDYDWQTAEREFQRALGSPSGGSDVHWAYGSLYLQPLGRHEESVSEMRREVDRDPLNVSYRAILASHLTHLGRTDEAIATAREASDLSPDNWLGPFTLGEALVSAERFDEALPTLERAHEVAPWHTMPTGVLAGALVRTGQHDRARALFPLLDDPRQPIGGALCHLLCLDLEAAAEWFARVIEQRDFFALVFADTPIIRPLRQSSHWPRLARMMNLPS